MSLISQSFSVKPGQEIATLAGGCFWGVERIFRQHFTGKGLIGIVVGYANGVTSKPTYEQVCTSDTKYAEAVQLLFDPKILSYSEIINFFLRIHDPTSLNRQGRDFGTQYRSAIFTENATQAQEAESVLEAVQKHFYPNDTLTTVIEPLKVFYDAEDYHQEYLEKNPSGYHCPTHFLRETPKA